MIIPIRIVFQVTPKRTNKPAFMLGRGRGRGRPYRGGYRGSHGYAPYRARGRYVPI
jgi:polyadenylate-binding protein 2